MRIFDLCYIPMVKQKETNEFVWYKFEVYEYAEECNLDVKGRRTKRKIPHMGVFRFNKNASDMSHCEKLCNLISLIKEETDPTLFDNDQILIKCLIVIKKHQALGLYPEKTCLATG